MPDEFTTATADGDIQQTSTEQVATGDTAQVEQTTEQTVVQQERTFRQSELDSIIKDRLTKEKQRYESETTKTKQEARDSWVAEQNYEWNGKPIKTEAEYKRALEEKEIEDKIRAQYSNVPDEIVQQLLEVNELKKWKTETEREKSDRETKETTERTKKETIQKQVNEFDDWYFKKNGKMADLSKDIPKEVFQANMQGVPLLHAYKSYLLDQSEGQQQTDKANQANAAASTGSARTSGTTGGALTDEMVAEMSPKELEKRWKEVRQLYKMK